MKEIVEIVFIPQADAADILTSTEKLSRSIDQMASNMGSAASRPAPAEMESPGNGSGPGFLPIGRGGRGRMGRARPSTAKESSDPTPAPSKSQPWDTRQTSSTNVRQPSYEAANVKIIKPRDFKPTTSTAGTRARADNPNAPMPDRVYKPEPIPRSALERKEQIDITKEVEKSNWSPPGTWDGQ